MPIIPKDTFIKYKVFHIFCILAILALYFCRCISSHLFSAIGSTLWLFPVVSIANNIYRASLGGKLIVIQWWCEILMLIKYIKAKAQQSTTIRCRFTDAVK